MDRAGYLQLDKLSPCKLTCTHLVTLTVLILCILLGYTAGPSVSLRNMTEKPFRCMDEITLPQYRTCDNEYPYRSNFDVSKALKSVEKERLQTITHCLLDTCKNMTTEPIDLWEQMDISALHYKIPLHDMTPKHRYIYVEVQFPHPTFLTANTYNVSMTAKANGLIEGNSWDNLIFKTEPMNKTIMCHAFQLYCEPAMFLRFGDVAYKEYAIDLLIHSASNETLPLQGNDALFYISVGNPAFSNWLLGFKITFFILSGIVTLLYRYQLRKITVAERTLEQQWVYYLLITLLFFNDPMYVLEIQYGTDLLLIVALLFQVTFFVMLLLFVLIMLDHIHIIACDLRFNASRFYTPKYVYMGTLWLFLTLVFGYAKFQDDNDPIWIPQTQYSGYLPCLYIATLLLDIYLFWTVCLFFRDVRYIASLPRRYRLFLGLTAVVFGTAIVGLLLGAYAPIPINAGEWTGFYALFNLYVMLLAFFYSPAASTGEMQDLTVVESKALSPQLPIALEFDAGEDEVDVV